MTIEFAPTNNDPATLAFTAILVLPATLAEEPMVALPDVIRTLVLTVVALAKNVPPLSRI